MDKSKAPYRNEEERLAYYARLRNLEYFLEKKFNIHKPMHYSFVNVVHSNANRPRGKFVIVQFRTEKNEFTAFDTKQMFDLKVRLEKCLVTQVYNRTPNTAVYVEISSFAITIPDALKAKSERSVNSNVQREANSNIAQISSIPEGLKELLKDLQDIHKIVKIFGTVNRDQPDLHKGTVNFNYIDMWETKRALKKLEDLKVICELRNEKRCNIRILLDNQVHETATALRADPPINNHVYTGKKASTLASWVLSKISRVDFKTPKEKRLNEIGITPRWKFFGLIAQLDDVIATLRHYGIIAISCGPGKENKCFTFMLLDEKRSIYEFYQRNCQISYNDMVNLMIKIQSVGALVKLPEDFDQVVPFWKSSNDELHTEETPTNVEVTTKLVDINTEVTTKEVTTDAEVSKNEVVETNANESVVKETVFSEKEKHLVLKLISEKLGIPSYNPKYPERLSLRFSKQVEGLEYRKLNFFKDTENSDVKEKVYKLLTENGIKAKFSDNTKDNYLKLFKESEIKVVAENTNIDTPKKIGGRPKSEICELICNKLQIGIYDSNFPDQVSIRLDKKSNSEFSLRLNNGSEETMLLIIVTLKEFGYFVVSSEKAKKVIKIYTKDFKRNDEDTNEKVEVAQKPKETVEPGNLGVLAPSIIILLEQLSQEEKTKFFSSPKVLAMMPVASVKTETVPEKNVDYSKILNKDYVIALKSKVSFLSKALFLTEKEVEELFKK